MTKDPIKKLLFVYNADSGVGNRLLDTAHKVFRPETYSCRLCELTYGVFLEKSAWKKFRKQSDIPMEFLHRDEFLKAYASKFIPSYTFPIVLELSEHDMHVFMGTEELSALTSGGELIQEIEKRLG